jgi:hypothetical protein
MKFYLSTVPPDMIDEPLSISVNNIRNRRKKSPAGYPLFNTPEEERIRELNELVSKPPFSYIYKAKKYDTL